MYKDFYHMNMEPFGTLPRPDVFFDSKTHKEAWYYLLFGIESQEPFLIITGDYGMGKTMLCLRLVQKLQQSKEAAFVYIATPNYTYQAILTEIAQSFNLSIKHEDESSIQSALYHFFRTQKNPLPVYIIVDDVQDLNFSTVQKLQVLVNFNHNGWFPFRCILFAHPAFLEKLAAAELRALDQRIRRRYQLANFDYCETRQYIYFRLYKAEAPGIPTFTEEAIQQIFSLSSGVPRLINNLCDACLLVGAAKGLTVIDDTIVRDALQTVSQKKVGDKLAEQEQKTTDALLQKASQKVPLQEEPVIYKSEDMVPKEIKKPRITARKLFSTLILMFTILLGVLVLTIYLQYRIITASRTSPEKYPASKTVPAIPKKTAEPDNAPKLPEKKIATSGEQKTQSTMSPLIVTTSLPKPEKSAAEETRRTIPPAETANKPLSEKTLAVDKTAPEVKAGLSINKDTESTKSTAQEKLIHYPYTLQLACYRSLEGALEEIESYKKTTMVPYLVKVNFEETGWWWVIYCGYFENQADAQKAKETYKLTDALVMKIPYANLIGSYSSDNEMQDMVNRLKKLGYHPYRINNQNGTFRLYVGGFATIREAEQLNQSLNAEGIKGQVDKR